MSAPAPTDRAGARLARFQANPRRALWSLAVPITVGMSIYTAYMMADMIFVGMLGPEALTAVAFNMPLLFLAMGTTFGFGSAVTALIAQAIGARDDRRANQVGQHSLAVGLVMTVAFTSIGLTQGRALLAAIGVPADLLPLAWEYFSVVAFGFAFQVLAILFRSIFSGEGEVKLPVMIQGVATLLNIALDPLFMFTFGLGVRGAAVATVVTQALVMTTFGYLLFVRRRSHVDLSYRGFRLDGAIVADLARIGAPASLSFLTMSVGGLAFNRILVTYSPDAVAAIQVGSRLDHLVVLPLVAMASSLVTLVGMFYGARRLDLVSDIARYALTRGFTIAVAVSAGFAVFAPWLVLPFTDSPEIRRIAAQYLRFAALAFPSFPFSIMIGRALQGLDRGAPELVLSLLRVLLISVPLAAVFTFTLELPLHFVWVAMIVGGWTAATLAITWWRRALARELRKAAEPEKATVEPAVDAPVPAPDYLSA
ncbi:MAG: MATE family efflux transporter [Thermoanaerobaculia bacterium]|nr:MATE family efflux transporter [Thermoanaerobaculia bacterium]